MNKFHHQGGWQMPNTGCHNQQQQQQQQQRMQYIRDAIVKVQRQKQRPTAARIFRAIRQCIENITHEQVNEWLESAVRVGDIIAVDNDGVMSYREPRRNLGNVAPPQQQPPPSAVPAAVQTAPTAGDTGTVSSTNRAAGSDVGGVSISDSPWRLSAPYDPYRGYVAHPPAGPGTWPFAAAAAAAAAAVQPPFEPVIPFSADRVPTDPYDVWVKSFRTSVQSSANAPWAAYPCSPVHQTFNRGAADLQQRQMPVCQQYGNKYPIRKDCDENLNGPMTTASNRVDFVVSPAAQLSAANMPRTQMQNPYVDTQRSPADFLPVPHVGSHRERAAYFNDLTSSVLQNDSVRAQSLCSDQRYFQATSPQNYWAGKPTDRREMLAVAVAAASSERNSNNLNVVGCNDRTRPDLPVKTGQVFQENVLTSDYCKTSVDRTLSDCKGEQSFPETRATVSLRPNGGIGNEFVACSGGNSAPVCAVSATLSSEKWKHEQLDDKLAMDDLMSSALKRSYGDVLKDCMDSADVKSVTVASDDDKKGIIGESRDVHLVDLVSPPVVADEPNVTELQVNLNHKTDTSAPEDLIDSRAGVGTENDAVVVSHPELNPVESVDAEFDQCKPEQTMEIDECFQQQEDVIQSQTSSPIAPSEHEASPEDVNDATLMGQPCEETEGSFVKVETEMCHPMDTNNSECTSLSSKHEDELQTGGHSPMRKDSMAAELVDQANVEPSSSLLLPCTAAASAAAAAAAAACASSDEDLYRQSSPLSADIPAPVTESAESSSQFASRRASRIYSGLNPRGLIDGLSRFFTPTDRRGPRVCRELQNTPASPQSLPAVRPRPPPPPPPSAFSLHNTVAAPIVSREKLFKKSAVPKHASLSKRTLNVSNAAAEKEFSGKVDQRVSLSTSTSTSTSTSPRHHHRRGSGSGGIRRAREQLVDGLSHFFTASGKRRSCIPLRLRADARTPGDHIEASAATCLLSKASSLSSSSSDEREELSTAPVENLPVTAAVKLKRLAVNVTRTVDSSHRWSSQQTSSLSCRPQQSSVLLHGVVRTSSAVRPTSNATITDSNVESATILYPDLVLFKRAQKVASERRLVSRCTAVESNESKQTARLFFGSHIISTTPKPSNWSDSIWTSSVYSCEFCLKRFTTESRLSRHSESCEIRRPPGNQIYYDANRRISVYEIDGGTEDPVAAVYCINLLLHSEHFIPRDSSPVDVDAVFCLSRFLILTHRDDIGTEHFAGCFIKEKTAGLSPSDALKQFVGLFVLPHYRRQGYGDFLVRLSCCLAQLDGQSASALLLLNKLTPEVSNLRHSLSRIVFRCLRHMSEDDQQQSATLHDIVETTGIAQEDVVSILQSRDILNSDIVSTIRESTMIDLTSTAVISSVRDLQPPSIELHKELLKRSSAEDMTVGDLSVNERDVRRAACDETDIAADGHSFSHVTGAGTRANVDGATKRRPLKRKTLRSSSAARLKRLRFLSEDETVTKQEQLHLESVSTVQPDVDLTPVARLPAENTENTAPTCSIQCSQYDSVVSEQIVGGQMFSDDSSSPMKLSSARPDVGGTGEPDNKDPDVPGSSPDEGSKITSSKLAVTKVSVAIQTDPYDSDDDSSDEDDYSSSGSSWETDSRADSDDFENPVADSSAGEKDPKPVGTCTAEVVVDRFEDARSVTPDEKSDISLVDGDTNILGEMDRKFPAEDHVDRTARFVNNCCPTEDNDSSYSSSDEEESTDVHQVPLTSSDNGPLVSSINDDNKSSVCEKDVGDDGEDVSELKERRSPSASLEVPQDFDVGVVVESSDESIEDEPMTSAVVMSKHQQQQHQLADESARLFSANNAVTSLRCELDSPDAGVHSELDIAPFKTPDHSPAAESRHGPGSVSYQPGSVLSGSYGSSPPFYGSGSSDGSPAGASSINGNPACLSVSGNIIGYSLPTPSPTNSSSRSFNMASPNAAYQQTTTSAVNGSAAAAGNYQAMDSFAHGYQHVDPRYPPSAAAAAGSISHIPLGGDAYSTSALYPYSQSLSPSFDRQNRSCPSAPTFQVDPPPYSSQAQCSAGFGGSGGCSSMLAWQQFYQQQQQQQSHPRSGSAGGMFQNQFKQQAGHQVPHSSGRNVGAVYVENGKSKRGPDSAAASCRNPTAVASAAVPSAGLIPESNTVAGYGTMERNNASSVCYSNKFHVGQRGQQYQADQSYPIAYGNGSHGYNKYAAPFDSYQQMAWQNGNSLMRNGQIYQHQQQPHQRQEQLSNIGFGTATNMMAGHRNVGALYSNGTTSYGSYINPAFSEIPETFGKNYARR